MSNCRYKKILQFYLDGLVEHRDIDGIEKHLRQCPECQMELAELEELNQAASEIIDEAPDRQYWESFGTRVRNRIISREIEPEKKRERNPARLAFAFRMASVMMAAFFIFGMAYVAYDRLGNVIPDVPSAGIEVGPGEDSAGQDNKNIPDTDQGEKGVEIPSLAENGPQNMPLVVNKAGSGARKENYTDDIQPVSPSMGDQFRGQSFVSGGKVEPSRFEELGGRFVSSYRANSDDKLRASYVNQRLLADVEHGGPSNVGSMADGGLTGEQVATWGYLSGPNDTSRSGELNRYLLELQLMRDR